jgi:GDP-D-mannose dehydratase
MLFIGEKLGWEAKTDLNELVTKMIKSDLIKTKVVWNK